MMDLLFILLMQTAAGDPATNQPAQTQTEAAATQQHQAVSEDTTIVLVPESETYNGVQCERVRPTGSRVRRRETVCTTQQTRSETRETVTTIANSGGRVQRGE